MTYVFQYGSNTSIGRLNSDNRLRGDARAIGAVLTRDDFELHFDVWSTKNECAAADIISGQGRQVWGVLYEIPDYLISRETSGNRRSLDAIEGPSYERGPIALIHPDGTAVFENVFTYVAIDAQRQCNIHTSLEYCRHIIAGLRDYAHQVAQDYFQYAKGRIIHNNPVLRADMKAL
jgi:hypothetical protein